VALQHREFRLFWAGAMVSSTGTWMQNVTVPYVLFQLTDSGTWVGLAVVAQILPSILLNPVAGAIADRYRRRNLLLVSHAVQFTAAAGLWVAWASGVRTPGVILAFVAVGGAAAMLTAPSWQAFVSELVPPEHLLNALTLNSVQANAARAVGPAIGGLVLGTLGAGWAFLLNASSFIAVLTALLLLRPSPRRAERPQGRLLAQFREAAAYSRRHTGLLTAFALTAAVCGLGYPVFQLATVFAERVYEVGPGRYGILTGAYGVGAIAGAVALGALGADRKRGDLVRLTVGVFGVSLIGMGLTTQFWQGLVMLAVVGAASLVAIATLNTSIQTQVAERLRGRVLALWVLSYTASYPLGSLTQGWLAERLGVRPTVAGAGGILCAVTVVLLVRPHFARSLDEHVHRRTLPVPGDLTPAVPGTPAA
jgi:MFS family permease